MPAGSREGLDYLRVLLERNEAHAREHDGLYASLKDGQAPKVVIALCSDSRIQSCVFGDSLDLVNNLFVGRDIGNTYGESEGAVDYAIGHLGVPVLFIMGHTGCGAAEAARGDFSKESAAIKERLSEISTRGDEARDPQSNVDAQVAAALEHYSGKVASGALVVLGGVFDLTGAYGGLHGKVYLTNINGKTDPEAVRAELGEIGMFPQDLLASTVKRI